ncbi:bifunctional diguanylate cyclase/phosphodiesterase [Yonghaparkia sp. Root332]|uniref:putative bifunctional diguanylate cyclase/phosphodiesterase n=1 Tax=Yonghaparkia sp. Root332 TaxID=1736516 RepID=UPI0006F8C869|nr:EAL domain-containing protein [Yonghaparkia sp. Root332]KQV24613.1 hypothetical protein ASC54_08775 [Yonghaparkia sp. Root332]
MTARAAAASSAGVDGRSPEVGPALLARALETVSEGSLITDAERHTIYANPAFTTITGYRADEIIGTNCRFLQGPETSQETVDEIRAALGAGVPFQGEILNYRADGRPFWNHLTITPIIDEAGVVTHFVSVQRDITHVIEERSRLSFEADHDALTGLPNRAALRRHVALELEDARETGAALAVVLIDLDLFKEVNDGHGHAAGDVVLIEFSRRLRGLLRRGDFVARLGGDEFVVVLSGLPVDRTHEELPLVLERLHRAVETPFSVAEGDETVVGMSAGVAVHTGGATDAAALYRASDDALYRAKSRESAAAWWVLAGPTGADRRVASLRLEPSAPSPVHPPAEGVLSLGAITMLYQPIVDLETGAVASVEALARLVTGDGRILGPEQFLPFCTGQELVELFRVGLDQTLAQLVAWDHEGLRLSASVNIPPELLSDDEVAATVARALSAHGVSADRLSLELLESGALDLPVSDRNVGELVQLGVRIHLDDVSSGFSTLKRMTELPFDVIKVDRRIFDAAHVRPLHVITLLAAIIRLGRDFGYGVVVEGIEDVEKLEVASILGARKGQGYLFARPLPAVEMGEWLARFAPPRGDEVVTTALGAIAYHWAAANSEGRVLPALEHCPLTAFTTGIDEHLARLHAEYHLMGGDRNPAGTALIDALVELVCAEGSRL